MSAHYDNGSQNIQADRQTDHNIKEIGLDRDVLDEESEINRTL